MTIPATDEKDTLIPLLGGFAARASTVVWLLETSFRLRFRVVDSELVVSPKRAITTADDAFIRQHRDELCATVTYIDKLCEEPV